MFYISSDSFTFWMYSRNISWNGRGRSQRINPGNALRLSKLLNWFRDLGGKLPVLISWKLNLIFEPARSILHLLSVTNSKHEINRWPGRLQNILTGFQKNLMVCFAKFCLKFCGITEVYGYFTTSFSRASSTTTHCGEFFTFINREQ